MCYFWLFQNQNTRNSESFLYLSSSWKKPFKCAWAMTRTVPLHCPISIGNSMICSGIWHKYHEWYFQIVIHNLRQFWNITSGIYAKYHVQIMLLFVYTTTHKRFVIFTSRYFKLSWNTTALSLSSISAEIRTVDSQSDFEDFVIVIINERIWWKIKTFSRDYY